MGSNDINQMVKNTNEIIGRAAEEILGKVTSNRKRDYFDDECTQAVERKKVRKLLQKQRNSRSNARNYQQQSIQTYRLLRRKKREHLRNEIENLETQYTNGNIRDFFKTVKKQRKRNLNRNHK